MRRLFLVPLVLSLTLLAAACGSSSNDNKGGTASGDDAAVVNGDHITQAMLDHRMNAAKCSYRQQKKTFPTPGTAGYQQLRSGLLQNLVQEVKYTQQAKAMNVTVTDKQVDAQMKTLKDQYCGGSEKKYRAQLKTLCVTDADVRQDARTRLLSDAIYKKLIAGIKVADAQVKSYYESHLVNFTTPQTRVVSHILVKKKALADRLYAQLKDGASFAALAKKYSIDPSSRANGGQLTDTRGSFVPQFEKAAFALRTGGLSKPVRSKYGWHIIHADKPATPHQTRPFSEVKASIKQQLLQQKTNAKVQTWLNTVEKEYKSKVSYAPGLAPPATTTTGTTTG